MFYTPNNVTDLIVPFLKPEWSIWESCYGKGHMATRLREHGFTVVTSDIEEGENFLTHRKQADVQVTNPPFSLKYQWLKRSYLLGRFALLLPLGTVFQVKGQRLQNRFGEVELIVPNKRIRFLNGFNRLGHIREYCVWVTWGLGIGKQITYVDISPHVGISDALVGAGSDTKYPRRNSARRGRAKVALRH